MTRSLSILVDLDGIVADLHPAWHERALLCCGADGQTRVHAGPDPAPTLEHVLEVYDGWTRLPCGDHVWGHLDSSLFEGLDPIPGAVDALGYLERLGHEITIVTASAKDPQTAAAKIGWVERHLKWTRHSVIVAQRKELIRGDVFIDDAPKNLGAWKAKNPDGCTITIAYPYNVGAPADFRAESWREPERAWAAIVGHVGGLR